MKIQNLFNLYIGDKSFNELLSLFNVEVLDDSEYYTVIAFNLLKYYTDEIMQRFDSLNKTQKIAIVSALGLFDDEDIDFNREIFLLDLLNCDDNDIIFDTILSLVKVDIDYCEKLEKYLSSENIMLKNASIQYFANKKGLLFKAQLRKFLSDDNAFIREVALDELDYLNDNDLIQDALFCLNDDSENVQNLARYILDKLK